ncbi:hypothetical protein [Haloprofundus salinisoli]|uniref:hypothetical protein n=1 Tax=Haloprofundus salinisoli TaxID=2876193 RepID=UPI001CD038F2|nr:hypothetical protein [Haloprofundus salinisoli]
MSDTTGETRTVEKSFRGISERLATHYLTNLGGERVEDDRVAGDDWEATLSSEKVDIGPTLDITEVTLVFEGDAETLVPLIEQFSQKAMRAGG